MNPELWDGRLLKATKPRKPGTKRTPLARQSAKQAVRQAFLAGVLAERIRAQGTTCERCGRCRELELHHKLRRSRAKGYDGHSFGADDPRSLEAICRRCHDKEHA